MGDFLFDPNEFLTEEQKADLQFTESYKGMKSEISRVAQEKVTIWGTIISWIYDKIFGNPSLTKDKQNAKQKQKSAKAFKKVKTIFEPEPTSSMTNEEILKHTKKSFK